MAIALCHRCLFFMFLLVCTRLCVHTSPPAPCHTARCTLYAAWRRCRLPAACTPCPRPASQHFRAAHTHLPHTCQPAHCALRCCLPATPLRTLPTLPVAWTSCLCCIHAAFHSRCAHTTTACPSGCGHLAHAAVPRARDHPFAATTRYYQTPYRRLWLTVDLVGDVSRTRLYPCLRVPRPTRPGPHTALPHCPTCSFYSPIYSLVCGWRPFAVRRLI